VSPRHDAYADASARVFDILCSVTPLCEPLSLDEAFLDVTASQKLFGAPADVARRLRARIADEVGLPASAGIAEVKLVAKIASDGDGPAPKRRVVALLDGRVERVHVHVQDAAQRRLRHFLAPSAPSCGLRAARGAPVVPCGRGCRRRRFPRS